MGAEARAEILYTAGRRFCEPNPESCFEAKQHSDSNRHPRHGRGTESVFRVGRPSCENQAFGPSVHPRAIDAVQD